MVSWGVRHGHTTTCGGLPGGSGPLHPLPLIRFPRILEDRPRCSDASVTHTRTRDNLHTIAQTEYTHVPE